MKNLRNLRGGNWFQVDFCLQFFLTFYFSIWKTHCNLGDSGCSGIFVPKSKNLKTIKNLDELVQNWTEFLYFPAPPTININPTHNFLISPPTSRSFHQIMIGKKRTENFPPKWSLIQLSCGNTNQNIWRDHFHFTLLFFPI